MADEFAKLVRQLVSGCVMTCVGLLGLVYVFIGFARPLAWLKENSTLVGMGFFALVIIGAIVYKRGRKVIYVSICKSGLKVREVYSLICKRKNRGPLALTNTFL